MKKKILFFIESLEVGGAEKSLVTLLNSADLSVYSVDLMMLKKGPFLKAVPTYVNVILVEDLQASLFKRSLYFILKKIKRGNFHPANYFWKVFGKDFKKIPVDYDIALAYSQGFATYFVAEKIKATKKIAWVNIDYKIAGYSEKCDRFYYQKIDEIVAVSQHVKDGFCEAYGETLAAPITVISDIIAVDDVINKASEIIFDLNTEKLTIVSVGRLVSQKSFSLAITAAKMLKNKNYDFNWYIVGEGVERLLLEDLINDSGLQNTVHLLGLKQNPYPYIKNCDIYAQTSLFEGLGLTVIEAKILGKAVVTTNFPTASQIIKDGKTGLICEMNPKSIGENIEKLILDDDLRMQLATSEAQYYNESKTRSLQEFYKLITAL